MNLKEFFLIGIPLVFLVLFLKGFLQSFFLAPVGNPFLGIALIFLSYRKVNVGLWIYLLFLGFISGIEINQEISNVGYFFLMGVVFYWFKGYLNLNNIKSKLLVWVINLLAFFVTKLFLFLLTVPFSFTFSFWAHQIQELLHFFVVTLVWVLGFEFFLKDLLIRKDE
ncbi:hypothetical protein [Thermodesulfobacterium hveragerdense]|uniref:hypothetical protein n=1 Tax=Thermodesulfobacterium hveragerdense TaxID=53424 RepID=UPI00041EE07D|nr:hypothetical protein [Thermodesulfobacterium hveragerdense]